MKYTRIFHPLKLLNRHILTITILAMTLKPFRAETLKQNQNYLAQVVTTTKKLKSYNHSKSY